MKSILKNLAPAAKRAVWIGIGVVSLLIGAIGTFLPVLPTTPFVILAAFAFGKSSPYLQDILETNAVFGPIILDWRRNGAIALRYKVVSIGMMASLLTLSVILNASPTVLVIQAVAIAAASLFILSRPGTAV
ncbi:YbaN family protein [Roseibium porphyridii]|uniref:YbaN family protein n=1 Tax=Roseibium porphyridii TaxID=2866279 RepID=A0ABY8F8R9_9HYPH|nr:YbaN family protein [Roseibium sp. KMA01]WFE91902.1 YbaN family protein [Roseibium sp. KMA01]